MTESIFPSISSILCITSIGAIFGLILSVAKIKLKVEVKESDITVDFDGTSPQVDWGGNVVYNFTYAYVFMAVKSAFDPDIPINEGAIRPVKMTAPEGTVVNWVCSSSFSSFGMNWAVVMTSRK